MSKNKNPAPFVAAPAVGAGAAAEAVTVTLTPAIETPAVADAKPDEAKPDEAKSETKNKIKVRSLTGGTFINPFTQEEIGSAETEATNDSWLQSQVDAKKIEQV